jgi:stage III sporulation protein AD
MDIVKIAMLGIAGTMLAIQMKSGKKEFELFISMGACILIFFFIVTKLDVVLDAVMRMQEYVQVDTKYIGILLKMIGITYVAEFSSNLCKDAGYNAISSQIEMFGKLSVLVISMPVLLALMDTIELFLS